MEGGRKKNRSLNLFNSREEKGEKNGEEGKKRDPARFSFSLPNGVLLKKGKTRGEKKKGKERLLHFATTGVRKGGGEKGKKSSSFLR